MTRRPWLVIVMLALLAISATTFVKAGRTYRPDDALALAIAIDNDIAPCEALVLPPVHERVAVLDDVPPLAPLVSADAVIAIAPKTSPPR